MRAVFQKTSTKPGVSYRSVAGTFLLIGIGPAGSKGGGAYLESSLQGATKLEVVGAIRDNSMWFQSSGGQGGGAFLIASAGVCVLKCGALNGNQGGVTGSTSGGGFYHNSGAAFIRIEEATNNFPTASTGATCFFSGATASCVVEGTYSTNGAQSKSAFGVDRLTGIAY